MWSIQSIQKMNPFSYLVINFCLHWNIFNFYDALRLHVARKKRQGLIKTQRSRAKPKSSILLVQYKQSLRISFPSTLLLLYYKFQCPNDDSTEILKGYFRFYNSTLIPDKKILPFNSLRVSIIYMEQLLFKFRSLCSVFISSPPHFDSVVSVLIQHSDVVLLFRQ